MLDLTSKCIVTGEPARRGGRRVHLREGDGESAKIIAVYAVNPDVVWTKELKAEKENAIRAKLADQAAGVSVPVVVEQVAPTAPVDEPEETPKRKLPGTK